MNVSEQLAAGVTLPADYFIKMTRQFQPPESALEELGMLPVIRILGPFAVGKTTTVENIVGFDDEHYSLVKGFTNRPMRDGETDTSPHRFIHSPASQAWLHDKLEHRKVVHMVTHPATGYLLGSTIDEYANARYPVIDLSYAHVDKVPSNLVPVMLVAGVEHWLEWVSRRANEPDYQLRVNDAHDCLTWALNQQPRDLFWVRNTSRNDSLTVEDITNWAQTGLVNDQAANRLLGKKMLDAIEARL
jgi:hypothetical protein